MTTFHSLTVANVEPETRDSVTITFAIPTRCVACTPSVRAST